jgi:hypothetical protein
LAVATERLNPFRCADGREPPRAADGRDAAVQARNDAARCDLSATGAVDAESVDLGRATARRDTLLKNAFELGPGRGV